MKNTFQKIWCVALPYQDKRNEKGHARITLEYARKLIKIEKGDPRIIYPSIMLHDIGWSQLSKEQRFTIFNKNATKEQRLKARYRHQEEGVRLAKGILNELNYPKEFIGEILEIISQHDTREGFLSKSEGLVRDADKLWRFSKIGLMADLRRMDLPLEVLFNKLIDKINKPNFFYSNSARQIACYELEERKNEQKSRLLIRKSSGHF